MGTILNPGDQAPDFTAPATGGEEFTLSDYHGEKNVVLYFYPKDDTPGCTMEARSFADRFPSFTEENTIIVGVSLDSVVSHDRFAKKHDLPFLLVSDEDGEVSSKYGVLPSGSTCSERVTFVIDKSGKIIRIFDTINVDTHGEEVLEVLPIA